ncbi:histidine kinase dimerization/phosphoacceptor domain -containing protein [Methanolobus chelungpuianus]|uniref:histidine kinase n=1 Tax=Methanolobus chelungpuianus TaxID=502115 RepID=A0AAE3H9V3_9EURY|nr:histidine kinase dimerization/phosphoacceptor domain -containing protein [Methanolobus chelungpuianus]MCQ6962401.1 histidine kinase [Methanolobus chelungpuianus]
MEWKDLSLKVKLILYIVVGTLLVLMVSTAMTISIVTSQEEELAYKQAIEMARNYANDFNGDMEKNKAIAETIAVSMSSYDSISREETNNMLQSQLLHHPHLLGTYVAFEPDAFDGQDAMFVNSSGHDATGRFIPYWNKISGSVHLNPLLGYDTLDYYQLPKKTKSDVLTEPYYYEGVFIVSYVSPIIKDEEFVGIGGVDVSLNYLDDTISDVKAFDSGYAFMTGNTGILVSHPFNKEWIGKKTLYDFNIPEISSAADNIRGGKSGYVKTTDPTTGEAVVMFYEPIRTGNFSFILVVPEDEMLAGVTTLSNKLLEISLLSIIFMAGAAYLIAMSFTMPIRNIVSDFKDISRDAVRGKLDSRAKTDVQKDFREIPMGLNDILDSVTAPVRDTIRLTHALAEGELSERSNLNVKGEFRQLANTLDDFAESLDTIIKDSSQVLSAVQSNDFSRQVTVYGEGDFRILTEGIEKTRKTLSEMIQEREKIEEIRKKEIHHRIKNNLQVISSLLDLEADKFTDENVIEAFKESQNRVISMALVHEELYRSQDMESIDFSDYLMKLVNELSYSYVIEKESVKIKTDVETVFLDMDTAIPLGMVVNELISNSFKHAFLPGEKGEICVKLSLENGRLTLIVRDNGSGFPEHVNFMESDSLGMQLVTTLISQIGGTIELENDNGTLFKITLS